jgi:hypothetical protein
MKKKIKVNCIPKLWGESDPINGELYRFKETLVIESFNVIGTEILMEEGMGKIRKFNTAWLVQSSPETGTSLFLGHKVSGNPMVKNKKN